MGHLSFRSSGNNEVILPGVKDVEYQVSNLKSVMDSKIGTETAMTVKTLPWLIDFASVLLHRYLVGRGGKTSYERLK